MGSHSFSFGNSMSIKSCWGCECNTNLKHFIWNLVRKTKTKGKCHSVHFEKLNPQYYRLWTSCFKPLGTDPPPLNYYGTSISSNNLYVPQVYYVHTLDKNLREAAFWLCQIYGFCLHISQKFLTILNDSLQHDLVC